MRYSLVFLPVLFVIIVLFAGCGGGGGTVSSISATPTVTKMIRISGRVIDGKGNPVSGAFVCYYCLSGFSFSDYDQRHPDLTSVTDYNGNYSFYPVPQGPYRINFWLSQSSYDGGGNFSGGINGDSDSDVNNADITEGQNETPVPVVTATPVVTVTAVTPVVTPSVVNTAVSVTTPAHTPTQGGGGGGGGPLPTSTPVGPVIASIDDNNGTANEDLTSNPIGTFTITGSNLGTSGTVRFYPVEGGAYTEVKDVNPGKNCDTITWSSTVITISNLTLGRGKYRVDVLTHTYQESSSLYYFKDTGSYNVTIY